MRETATPQHASPSPPWMASLTRLRSWTRRPETCSRCTRACATQLHGDRALCGACADPNWARTLALQARTTRLLAEAREAATPPGLVGVVLPFLEPVLIKREGHWEQLERGAFTDCPVVALTLGHRGQVLAVARTIPHRHALVFEADHPQPGAVLRGCVGVSASFVPIEVSTEPYRGGHLRRIHRARLSEIALLRRPDVPAYRQAWCWSRTPAAWQRVYGGLQAELARAAADA